MEIGLPRELSRLYSDVDILIPRFWPGELRRRHGRLLSAIELWYWFEQS